MAVAEDRIKDEVAAWTGATAQVREVVKWIASAFAGLGALLIGTAPLAGLPQVDPALGVVLAVLAFGVLGLSGVAHIVWRATTLLTPTMLSLAEVDSDGRFEGLRTQIDADPSAYLGSWATTLPGFIAAVDDEYAVLANIDALKSTVLNEADFDALEEAEKDIVTRIEGAGRVTRRLLAIAGFVDLNARFNAAKSSMFMAAGMVVVGMVGFLVVTGESKKGADPEPTQLPAMVSLMNNRGALARTLGRDCPSTFQAVVLEGGAEGPWTLLVSDRKCRGGVISVSKEEGRVLLTYGKP